MNDNGPPCIDDEYIKEMLITRSYVKYLERWKQLKELKKDLKKDEEHER